ncbi:SPOR domain-containing protein [Thermocrinis jamiesonii]|uniref:SPOR domain-containing protein n=1 Tax=Thermocrinis jamiesonii TaxID=1302351 RepID=UPI0004975087|nr:SPOR domain-containing protein [Thermocrinis jamiesonii]
MNRRERLIVLVGILIALIFFYLGLNQWLKQKTPAEPPPIVVKPTPKPPEESQPKVEKVEQPAEQKPEKEEKDLIAEKIKEEKKKAENKPEQATKNNLTVQKDQVKKEKREYVIQIGAFIHKENAEKVLEKAKRMGYSGEIINEDKFYKVRVKVRTDNLRAEMNKLRSAFGNVIVKK